MAIAPVRPRAYSQKDSIVEIARTVKTGRGTRVGSIVVVAVRANRRGATDSNRDLGVGLRHENTESEQDCQAEQRLASTPGEIDRGFPEHFHLDALHEKLDG